MKHFCMTLVVICASFAIGAKADVIRCPAFRNCMVLRGVSFQNIVCRHDPVLNSTFGNYTYLNYQWNRLIREIRPIGYFLPENAAQVQTAFRCVRHTQIRLVPKSGGHGYGKYAFGTDHGIVVDLQKMTSLVTDLSLNPNTAEVGPGFLGGPLAQALFDRNTLLPNGLCPTVGISYSLGGGYSFLSRRYGLVGDNILELDMVNYNGTLLTASPTQNSDLFFALRGAGGGNFGIVVRYKFKTYPIPAKIVYGRKPYKMSEFTAVFKAWQEFTKDPTSPPISINSIMTLTKGEVLIEIIEIHETETNPDPSTVQNMLDGMPFPKSTTDGTVSVLEFYDYLTTVGAYGASSAGIGAANRHDYAPVYFHGTSFYVPIKKDASGELTVLDDAAVQKINKVVQKIPKYVSCELQLNGGAINNFEPSDTAYVHRKQNIYKVNADYLGVPGETKKKQQRRALKWQSQLFEVTKEVMGHTESYQNNVDPNMKNYLQRYYGANLNPLIQIKRIYDPTNYFQNPQSIPV